MQVNHHLPKNIYSLSTTYLEKENKGVNTNETSFHLKMSGQGRFESLLVHFLQDLYTLGFSWPLYQGEVHLFLFFIESLRLETTSKII